MKLHTALLALLATTVAQAASVNVFTTLEAKVIGSSGPVTGTIVVGYFDEIDADLNITPYDFTGKTEAQVYADFVQVTSFALTSGNRDESLAPFTYNSDSGQEFEQVYAWIFAGTAGDFGNESGLFTAPVYFAETADFITPDRVLPLTPQYPGIYAVADLGGSIHPVNEQSSVANTLRIPEPSTALLGVAGLATTLLRRRKA